LIPEWLKLQDEKDTNPKQKSSPKAVAKLKEIEKLAEEKDVRLICYEKNPPCHRFILVDLINSL